ncbi:helix-turn-helix transcriptional regulator [Tissierella sp. Yu-01]|uniref:helix-turn-helix domain-containing protein n=1 Tax=Tissierella sp. Yu-01 TaxID=3035694 RepID=UPI00240D8400|nr:helix-turn-helix transcriptional regulator [Tissierella sp. Yu-01]WFA10376.1 helix-turn-helix transcriptional regulator [Tissierella sp. Yu-01]
MDLIKLGKILKSKRDDLGLSLRDAGKLIGISHNYLSILEKAKDPRSEAPITPTIDTLKLVSDAYKLDINLLLPLAGYTDIKIKPTDDKYTPTLPDEFNTPEEAIKFLLEQNVIMGFGGFDLDKLSDEEKIEFANELLGQLKLLSYKYKK